ncbi:tannase/feruloyl esterase family alpha/beta hydrolase [Cellulomonas sp. PhB143]|uniref:tannase/feruloyl esterase family alpha/beta hydrolase n=1 Tax=Cellulomonas sp. PhB143 TaxID=2485186 RepID=UPI000F4953EA|nr:tannase/feruloyl esterase family alpha/beta hydrolase [Cellulomonas sp. PhB143]ROS75504.1 tannase/feruloyl esterase [Cellulomonas sp. PhB143]
MRRTPALLSLAVSVLVSLTLGYAPAGSAAPRTTTASATTAVPTASAATTPRPSSAGCAGLTVRPPAGASLVSVRTERDPGGTVTFPVQPGYEAAPPPVTGVPAFCKVDVTLTHGSAGDRELVEVWLPESGWSGRFQALGGSGYAAGNFGPDLAAAVKAGYAVGSTDAGATPVTGWTSPWALTGSGHVNVTVLENFAERAPHELALVGKAVTRAYYGSSATYAYWNGCSTGGRQGYMEAQRHPDDFDGILAGSPAVSWDRFAVAALWPNVVMNQEHDVLAPCELTAFTNAAIKACDPLDGVTDGVIDDPLHCAFDPRTLVGRTIDCDGTPVTITAKDATVLRKIWQGPTTTGGFPLWYGLPKGAELRNLAGESPFPVAASWVQDFVARDRSLDLSTVTYAQYTRLFAQSVLFYHGIIGSDQSDLSDFRRSGGKLLSWHGLADQLVPVGGTIRYYDQVADRSRGPVDDYYRLFLAPGAAHCASGAGPAPTDPLGALVRWVERGDAPATLAADTTREDGTPVHRDLCPYPAVPQRTVTSAGHSAGTVTRDRCVSPAPHRA